MIAQEGDSSIVESGYGSTIRLKLLELIKQGKLDKDWVLQKALIDIQWGSCMLEFQEELGVMTADDQLKIWQNEPINP